MYLDTDLVIDVLNGGEENQWMKIFHDGNYDLKTSEFTLMEMEEVMEEFGDKISYEKAFSEIKETDIELISMSPKVIKTIREFNRKYKGVSVLGLEHFIHSAHVYQEGETILSQDDAYRKIEEIDFRDVSLFETISHSKSVGKSGVSQKF